MKDLMYIIIWLVLAVGFTVFVSACDMDQYDKIHNVLELDDNDGKMEKFINEKEDL